MYFVTEVISTGVNRTTEYNVRLGGFKSLKRAAKAAIKHRPAIIRNDSRQIIHQTVNPELPFYIN